MLHATTVPTTGRHLLPGAILGYRRNGAPIRLQAGGDGTDENTQTAYAFPFDVPEDLSAVATDDLNALLGQVREHAAGFNGQTTPEALTALRACRDLAVRASNEITERANREDELAALNADIAAATTVEQPDDSAADDEDDDTDGDGDGEPEGTPAAETERQPEREPVVASRRTNPPVRRVARTSRTRRPDVPEDTDTRFMSMTASADVPGFAAGQRLERFDDAARALAARLDQYPGMTAGRAGRLPTGQNSKRPVTVYDPDEPGRQLVMQRFTRHNAVQFRREFPDDLRVREGDNGYAVAEYAARERRLPGGNLRESARLAVEKGRSLTAAAGWCAPSEVMYDLLELETLDGMLDLPELQTTRGGWQIPVDGGPDFASIYGSLGNAGDTHLTEAEVIADTQKVCTEIPCPPFEDVRLGVDYICLTGGLLQRRGYPEVVARFGRGAVVGLAHKINAGVIASIVAASGTARVVPADASGDDAISGLLSAVDLAIADAKYRNRMGFNATLEVVLPMWVLVQLRAAGSRRSGVDMVGLTDAQILNWFAIRNAVPRFVYDWQDAFSGLSAGPGGATPLTALPTTVQFVVYPAGTWVKAVQDVVQLDTIYDSTMLATNQYTAVFAEDGWAALQMGGTSRLYTAPVDPSGVVGCCPLPETTP
ncbi:major capsid protein [Micromonospora sp. WMMC273]|uniref:major capsid protein n=1 Tax=Micromonospora sp. WMMC273 TaxID=3015157 RepID=UPI0022B703A9|nr:major capsid protein [Micromonospora sp. WMMC273]MCZ7478889.1 major capsid protein [Micromonospora sp. WMMC273]